VLSKLSREEIDVNVSDFLDLSNSSRIYAVLGLPLGCCKSCATVPTRQWWLATTWPIGMKMPELQT